MPKSDKSENFNNPSLDSRLINSTLFYKVSSLSNRVGILLTILKSYEENKLTI
nr:MAG TPA: hypothetical protein [Caudoviricetes sp.]